MQTTDLNPAMRFRRTGRTVLQSPEQPERHAERIRAAWALTAMEPLQGAMADMLHACRIDRGSWKTVLNDPRSRQRLFPRIIRNFEQQVRSGCRLPAATPLATRYSILTTPSFDVASRGLLVNVDASRRYLTEVREALVEGDAALEEEFLKRCVMTSDALAFMYMRRQMKRAGRPLSAAWEATAERLLRRDML